MVSFLALPALLYIMVAVAEAAVVAAQELVAKAVAEAVIHRLQQAQTG